MLNNAAPAVDVEMQQFQDDLLQSIREFKAGCLKSITRNQPRFVDEVDAVRCLHERQLSE